MLNILWDDHLHYITKMKKIGRLSLTPSLHFHVPSHHVMIHVAKLFDENMVTVLISKVAFALSLAIKLQVHVSDQQCKIVISYKSYYIATGKKKVKCASKQGSAKEKQKHLS